MKYFITGCSGFIGREITSRLLREGHDVLGLARRSFVPEPAAGSFRQCVADMSCWGTFESEAKSFAPDVIIHAAWIRTHDYSEKACRLNHMASVNLFSFAFGLESVKTVVGLGSCLEYGPAQAQCSETCIVAPETFFAWCKNSLREYGDVQSRQTGKAFRWMRIFYAYGPGQRSAALIPTILDALKAGVEPELKNPSFACDLVHVDDIAKGVVLATKWKESGSQSLNLGRGSTVTAKSVSASARAIWNGTDGAHIEKGTGSCSHNGRIREHLHWEPEVSIEQGLKSLVSAAKSGGLPA
ncbi:MAG: NAD(P)-dependent oxidoreductase [Verrucomicrobiae bacterium]